MSGFSAAQKKAQAAIEDLRGACLLAEMSESLVKQYARQVFHFDRYEREIKEIVRSALSHRAADSVWVYRGLFVQTCTIFEEFIRDTLESYVSAVQKMHRNYDTLPKDIRNNHIAMTGRVFSRINEGINGRIVDYNTIAKTVGTCYLGSESYTLNNVVFSVFVANCTTSAVEQFLKKAGYGGDIWSEIAKGKEIQKVLGTKAAKETEKQLMEYVDKAIATRNSIVHSYGAVASSQEVIEACNIYSEIVSGISSVLASKFH